MHQRHPKLRNIAGLRFGKLTAISEAGLYQSRRVTWLCRCDCGEETVVRGDCLRSGVTKSCGCNRRELPTTHGLTLSPEYNSWCSMKGRCLNANDQEAHNYSQRGITVCDRWLNSFEAFYEDMGPRPSPSHSLDRHPDKNGNYEPGNCRWATATEQVRNRRVTVMVSVGGKDVSLAEAALRAGVRYATAWNRMRLGWPIERVLTAERQPTGRARQVPSGSGSPDRV